MRSSPPTETVSLAQPDWGTPLLVHSPQNRKRCQSELCCGSEMPLAANQSGFETEGADFCFSSPWAEHTIDHETVARDCDAQHKGWQPMTFTIWVKDASVDHVTATLQTGSSSMTEPPAKDTDGSIGEAWGQGHELVFSFDYPCDFDQTWRLVSQRAGQRWESASGTSCRLRTENGALLVYGRSLTAIRPCRKRLRSEPAGSNSLILSISTACLLCVCP